MATPVLSRDRPRNEIPEIYPEIVEREPQRANGSVDCQPLHPVAVDAVVGSAAFGLGHQADRFVVSNRPWVGAGATREFPDSVGAADFHNPTLDFPATRRSTSVSFLIHIAAKLLGHLDLDTTSGYVSVYPVEVVRHFQAAGAAGAFPEPLRPHRAREISLPNEVITNATAPCKAE